MEFLFVTFCNYIYQQQYLQAISLPLVRLPGVSKTSKKLCCAQTAEIQKKEKKNPVSFGDRPPGIYPFPYQPFPWRSKSLIGGAVWFVVETGPRNWTARSCQSFQLPHPVWPSGVSAPKRSHFADYLCRLWSFLHQIYLSLPGQWCVCSEFGRVFQCHAQLSPCVFLFFFLLCVCVCYWIWQQKKKTLILMWKTPGRNEMELLSERILVGFKFCECIFAAVFPPKQ